MPESTNLSTLHPGTLAWEELDLLSELVWAYEQHCYAISPPDLIALLNSKLESGELNLDQLKEVLPNRSTRSQVLNKKRRISMKAALEMVDREWVPVESFFQTSYWSSFERQRFIRKYSFLLSSAI
ncbi:MAG: hypothetical protein WBA23_13825 [Tunicatimonas sp.]|uniref:hypothetical protein n=1 Tax=Tunicatimonas sp. TaxID=1940096 RepID=UPI003C757716